MLRSTRALKSATASAALRPTRACAAVRLARSSAAAQTLAGPAALGGARHFASFEPLHKVSSDPRYTSKKWADGEVVTYEELKPLTESPSDAVLVIDVREPDEVALGNIPSSVNIPLSGFEKSLSLDEGDFTRIHGFHKPTKAQQIIFYCRSGKRSTTATDLAKRAGYRAVRNYTGSWLDWQAKDTKNDD
ncbi:hypothetical protein RQP46_009142 [Phenoliferia psychrophenolica]